MVGAARSSRRQAASLGLLSVFAVACASAQNPPGGPPDFAPPELVAITPDSGTVNPDFGDELLFTFNEVIDERSGGGLANLFEFSPRDERLRVRWHRKSIGLKPRDGWRPNTVYHVRLDSMVSDLRQNRLGQSHSVIFTTGGEIPNTELSGIVLDWEANRAATNALIEALLLPDSLVYVARTDSVGRFSMSALPRGSYAVYAVIDANNSGTMERRESFDSLLVDLNTSGTGEFWTIPHDTLGPRIRTASQIDSVTFSIEFSQPLHPARADSFVARVRMLPDSTPVDVVDLRFETVHDSIVALARAVADSIRRDSIAALDTLPADTATIEPVDTPETPLQGLVPETPDEADSTDAQRLLATRPRLERTLVVVVAEGLQPGARYVVEATVVNVTGAVADSRSVLAIPEPPPEEIQPEQPDSLSTLPTDTLAVPVDSLPGESP